MSYFEEGGILFIFFNVILSFKFLWYLVKWIWIYLCKKKMRRKLESFGIIGVRVYFISVILVVEYVFA